MSGGHIGDAEVRRVQRYLDQIKVLLGVGEWVVYVAVEPTDAEDDNAIASVHPTEGRKVAAVRIGPGWDDRDPDEKRHSLVHELLHLIHRDQTDLIRKGLPASGYLPGPAFDLLWEPFRLATEIMVDHLTTLIAPNLPAWPGQGR